MDEIERPITAPELAQYLGVHLVTIYRWTSERKIPVARVGRRVRYYLSKVKESIERNGRYIHVKGSLI